MLLLAALVEVAVIAVILRLWNLPLAAIGMVAWIALLFLAYRLGLSAIGYQRPCGCAGDAFAGMGVPPAVVDTVTGVMLGYLLVGSLGLFLWARRTEGPVAAVPPDSMGGPVTGAFEHGDCCDAIPSICGGPPDRRLGEACLTQAAIGVYFDRVAGGGGDNVHQKRFDSPTPVSRLNLLHALWQGALPVRVRDRDC